MVEAVGGTRERTLPSRCQPDWERQAGRLNSRRSAALRWPRSSQSITANASAGRRLAAAHSAKLGDAEINGA